MNVTCSVMNLRKFRVLVKLIRWAPTRNVHSRGSKFAALFSSVLPFSDGTHMDSGRNHGSLSNRSLLESFLRGKPLQLVLGQTSGRWMHGRRQNLRFYRHRIQAKDQALDKRLATACALQKSHTEEVQAILWVCHQASISNAPCTGMQKSLAWMNDTGTGSLWTWEDGCIWGDEVFCVV